MLGRGLPIRGHQTRGRTPSWVSELKFGVRAPSTAQNQPTPKPPGLPRPSSLEGVTEQRMNVESFNLDHRLVAAPYLRLADRKQLPQGDVIVKYDVRFAQ